MEPAPPPSPPVSYEESPPPPEDGWEPEPGLDAERFTVQVGAFSVRKNAERRFVELVRYSPHIEVIRGEDGELLYTVRIGSFDSRELAELEAAAIELELEPPVGDDEAVLVRPIFEPLTR